MSTKPDGQNPPRVSRGEECEAVREAADGKKPFVEPEVSSPVDVLEATTFFQTADSGGTP
ncbi:MAG TPA: hypothetical protein VKB12_18805 [Pyrinomonadaceae bacterium]|nr:hypothetical protein [Pyrinomonadaceae bacterium]